MRKILLTLFVLGFAYFVNAQDYSFPKNNEGVYEFSEVVDVNLSKSTLFSNATTWANKFYEEDGYKNVVQFESEQDGRLVIKAHNVVIDRYEVKTKMNFRTENIYYILTIDCKDNKYRYIINDIKIKEPSSTYASIGFNLEYDVTHEGHLNTIDKLKQEKADIESQMQNYKGRKLSKAQKQLDDINEKIKAETDLYTDEFNLFDRLIKTLKKAMATNTDF